MTHDPNAEAARVVRETTGDGDALPPDMEAAWEAWIGSIKGIDERARTLLRAAFEAGVEAGARSDWSKPGSK